MSNYIDGFAFPIKRMHLDKYKAVASSVAAIWKEHGALAYFEYEGDDMELNGTLSFIKCLEAQDGETVIFGWVVFPSREARDQANKLVANDPRMHDLLIPLMNEGDLVFNAQRMAYGGFKSFV